MSWFISGLLRAPINFFRSEAPARNLAILATGKTHYKVLVAGGGTAGCTVASKLRDVVPVGAVGVIEPEEYHYYQGAWTLVGAGMLGLPDTRIAMREAIPSNAEWIKDKVASFDPVNNKVITVGGKQITYDFLVICLGMALRYDMIRGSTEALEEDSRVCSNYSKYYVEKTFKAIQKFNGGTAIFTLPHTPIKCAGAPQMVMYLFEDYLVRNNKKKDVNILYFTATKTLFSVPKYSQALEKICQMRGINYNLGQNLVEVDHKRSIAVIENMETKKRQEYKYDLLHLTPPMSAPAVLKTGTDLSSQESNGFVTVNPATLRHIKYANIFALGDCSNIPTSKTAAAISSESQVLCENLTDVIGGGSGEVAKYNGYTSCPLITGYRKGILAEFDYNLTPIETFPIDQSQERAFFAWLKRSILPSIYWNGLIKGLWSGPSKIRSILHLGRARQD